MSTTAEYLAERFHEAYERLSPKNVEESRVAWADVPDNRKYLMVAVCQDLLDKKVITVL